MKLKENEFRDFLFDNYKENFSSIVIGKREPVVWEGDDFPPIHFLLQHMAEKRINEIIDDLDCLIITAKELRLQKSNDSTTRIDLFGNSETSGITIIELKKSKQTERQSFTELLAYTNHFCSIFPGLNEKSITSILVAPMETRTVRDAYVQELVINKKKTLALIPKEENGKITLKVYYPDKSYYQWFENNLFDDRSMITVALSFPVIEGWIDTDLASKDRNIPDYSKKALNTISSTIALKLESLGIHGLVFSSQLWGEIPFPHPNKIYVGAVDPFAAFRTSIHDNEVYGVSEERRLESIQSIFNQISDDEKIDWIEFIGSSFHDDLIGTIREEFELCFLNTDHSVIHREITTPHWSGVKCDPRETAISHNLDVYLTGLLREIYYEYVKHVYDKKEDPICYGDDLPGYSYDTLRAFLPIWEILSGIGVGDFKE